MLSCGCWRDRVCRRCHGFQQREFPEIGAGWARREALGVLSSIRIAYPVLRYRRIRMCEGTSDVRRLAQALPSIPRGRPKILASVQQPFQRSPCRAHRPAFYPSPQRRVFSTGFGVMYGNLTITDGFDAASRSSRTTSSAANSVLAMHRLGQMPVLCRRSAERADSVST